MSIFRVRELVLGLWCLIWMFLGNVTCHGDFLQLVSVDVQPVTNSSSQFLDVGIEPDETTQSGFVHFKLLGQPDQRVGYATFVQGHYLVVFDIRLQSAAHQLDFLARSPDGTTVRVPLTSEVSDSLPNTWQRVTIVLVSDPDTTVDRFRFNLRGIVEEETAAIFQIDYVRITRVADSVVADLLKGQLDFEPDHFRIGDRPPAPWINKTGAVSRFIVARSKRWLPVPDSVNTRVQLHSRFGPRLFQIPYSEYLLKPADPCLPDSQQDYPYWHSFRDVSLMGGSIWTRHVKSYTEGPHWLSNFPVDPDLQSEDYIAEHLSEATSFDQSVTQHLLTEAESNGLDLIAYYRFRGDGDLEIHAGYDQWFVANPDGTPRSISTDPTNKDAVPASFMSVHSPYLEEVVLGRIVELAQQGFSGAYFDGSHGVPNGDWSVWAEQAFAPMYGEMPAQRTLGDLQYRNLLRLQRDRLRDFFVQLQDVLQADYPQFASIVSAHTYPSLWQLTAGQSLVSQLQIAKTEFHLGSKQLQLLFNKFDESELPAADQPQPNLLNRFGMVLTRDTTNGRPPHVWIFNPARLERFDEDNIEIPDWESGITIDQLLAAMSTTLACGAVANLDVPDRPPSTLPNFVFSPALNLNLKLENWVDGLTPIRSVGIHVSETARDQIYDQWMTPSDSRSALLAYWQQLIAPTVFSFHALEQEGVGVGLVTDHQLAAHEFDGLDVLVLPSGEMTYQQELAVAAFE